jgi:esterase
MQIIRVNGHDMAYLTVGNGRPLVCVHGTLGDFRTWHPVIGPLARHYRVITVSLRHFFPEHWDGTDVDYRMAQHIADVIAFIEHIEPKPVDLMGHSRGGHIAFRVAQQRPELLRRLVLAEPAGDLDASLAADNSPDTTSKALSRIVAAADKVRFGDIDGAMQLFVDWIDGEGAWRRLPAAAKQHMRDNATTLLGQISEAREPYCRADMESIRTPTLLVGGADTAGTLASIWRVMAKHIAGARTATIAGGRHWMFDDDPQAFARAVMDFLGD